MIQPLSPDSFSAFFHALWGYDPFPWQADFARRLCAGEPVDFVTVPTGSGKTACLDAAVFALAVQSTKPASERTAGRRIFFIVNRRIIVDEAHERANQLAKKLQKALSNESGILSQVAKLLHELTGGENSPPLACAELRGGIYRDRTWARSILQPMILCSTVDQAGSRLLFRGYGVTHEARPIHAALVAHDSLLLVDEAHISQPFLQTLDWVKRYRLHQPQGAATVHLPFSLVCMTATPPKRDDAVLLELSEKDRAHPVLSRRLNATKPVRLVTASKAKGRNATDELATVLEAEAATLIASEPAPKSIAIMVNRVVTAREVEKRLRKKYSSANVTLIIGRMRPLDRDRITKELQALLKTGKEPDPAKGDKLQIVVSTQCLEVGADLDFDALVSECASLDALRQRFGRLNRDGRPIAARGVIVLPEDQRVEESKLNDEKLADPIYGNATPRTWRWLESIASDGIVDFGLNAMTEAVKVKRQQDEASFELLLMPRENAPVLLPAYLDCLVQTNPAPAVEPDVSLFLHGPQRDMAEVQVCWRADLPEDPSLWKDTVSLCPPTSLECLPVPLPLIRDFLKFGFRANDENGDSPATVEEEGKSSKKPLESPIPALCWLDEKSHLATPDNLKRGQTIVLREQDKAWQFLGHIPDSETQRIDQAERGQLSYRRRVYLRLHKEIWQPAGEKDSAADRLNKWARITNDEGAKEEDVDLTDTGIKAALAEIYVSLEPESDLAQRLDFLAKQKRRLVCSRYPDDSGIVITSYTLFPAKGETEATASEDGPDDPLLENSRKQTLHDHTAHVTRLANEYATALGLHAYHAAITTAAKLHDIGKSDPRFQAMLIQGTISAAYAQPCLWAKSDNIPNSAKAREEIRNRAILPKGFRHEMLSVQLAVLHESVTQTPFASLILHLIASHHGHARPFAPLVPDDDPPTIEWENNVSLSRETRLTQPAHALDSGLAERFWQLTRHHGWWGLSLLESILRLADQTASANPEISIKPS